MSGPLASASEHPATGKFDFPLFHPADLAAWQQLATLRHGRGDWAGVALAAAMGRENR